MFSKIPSWKKYCFPSLLLYKQKGEGRERVGWWSGRRKEKEGNEEEGEGREEVFLKMVIFTCTPAEKAKTSKQTHEVSAG